jgi:hypothetical protein
MLHNKINYKQSLSLVLVQNRQITDTPTKSSDYTFMVHLERFQCKTAIAIQISWKIWSSEVVIWACFMPDQSSSPQTDMSLLRHIDYLDSLIFLLNSTYLAEKQVDPNFIVDGFTRPYQIHHLPYLRQAHLLHQQDIMFYFYIHSKILWLQN